MVCVPSGQPGGPTSASSSEGDGTGLLRLVPSLGGMKWDSTPLQHIPKAQDPGFLHPCRLGQCDSVTVCEGSGQGLVSRKSLYAVWLLPLDCLRRRAQASLCLLDPRVLRELV